MSETQSYKTVTFSDGELSAISFALDVRIIVLKNLARTTSLPGYYDDLITFAESALVKVEAAL